MWEGKYNQPLSLNSYLYVLANPANLIDPSGYVWDDTQKENIRRLKKAFLDSAKRHNQIPTMDDNGFAALIAATIAEEGHLDAAQGTGPRDLYWVVENKLIDFGCIVSGSYIESAAEGLAASELVTLMELKSNPLDYELAMQYAHLLDLSLKRLIGYLRNELPDDDPLGALASVGIGNVKLYTAANVWQGQACRIVEKGGGEYVEQCVVAEASSLRLGGGEDIPNPFEGAVSYDPSVAQSSYQTLGKQLRDEEKNIEYVAAIFEQGAQRAYAIGLEPSAFNSVTGTQETCIFITDHKVE